MCLIHRLSIALSNTVSYVYICEKKYKGRVLEFLLLGYEMQNQPPFCD